MSDARKEAQSRIVLTSPSGKFQVTLELFDDGKLLALLDVKQPDGRYKRQPSEKRIAEAREQPTMKGTWYIN